MSIPLTLETLCDGGAVERLRQEIQKALENINDPNTPAKKARTVKLAMKIKPNEQRNMAEVMVETSSTLCAPQPLETSILIDQDREGNVVAAELAPGQNPGQAVLPETMEKGKVLSMPPKEGTNA